MVEVLKQGQYQPMDVAEQIMIIYAGNNGYLDDIEVEDVMAFEKELHKYTREKYPEVLEEIKSKGKLDDELEAKIKQVIQEAKEAFQAQ